MQIEAWMVPLDLSLVRKLKFKESSSSKPIADGGARDW